LKVITQGVAHQLVKVVQGNLIPQGELKVDLLSSIDAWCICPRKSNSPRGIERLELEGLGLDAFRPRKSNSPRGIESFSTPRMVSRAISPRKSNSPRGIESF